MPQTRHHLPHLHLACWCQTRQNFAIERCAQSSLLGLGTAASLPHPDECNALCLRMRYSADRLRRQSHAVLCRCLLSRSHGGHCSQATSCRCLYRILDL